MRCFSYTQPLYTPDHRWLQMASCNIVSYQICLVRVQDFSVSVPRREELRQRSRRSSRQQRILRWIHGRSHQSQHSPIDDFQDRITRQDLRPSGQDASRTSGTCSRDLRMHGLPDRRQRCRAAVQGK